MRRTGAPVTLSTDVLPGSRSAVLTDSHVAARRRLDAIGIFGAYPVQRR